MKNSNIFDLLIIVALFTLMIIRFFVPEKSCSWISAINFGGIIIASFSLYSEIKQESNTCKKFNTFTGVFLLIMIFLIIIEVLVIVELINFSAVINDIITLITLVISLPAKLHKKVLIKLLK